MIPEQQAPARLVGKAVCQPEEIFDIRNGGECWTCPKTWDRTIYPIHGTQACEEGAGYRYAKAQYVKPGPSSCPAGQFLDVVGVSQAEIHSYANEARRAGDEARFSRIVRLQPVQTGTCWSCPPGTTRGHEHVKSAQACLSNMIDWVTNPYPEPGLFGLAGAEQVLLDMVTTNPGFVSAVVRQEAIRASAADPKRRSVDDHTQEAWTRLGKEPNRSSAAAAIVLPRLLAAIADPQKASAAERDLVKSFSEYIKKRRTYIAQDALNAYYAWKKADAYWKGQQKTNLIMLFDYGTPPPDFTALATVGALSKGAAGMAVGEIFDSLPVIGDALGIAIGAIGSEFNNKADPVGIVVFGSRTALELLIGKAIEALLTKMATTAVTTGMGTVGSAMQGVVQATGAVLSTAGPGLVIGISAIIFSVALDQVIAINEAEGKLKAALAQAGLEPQLQRMVVSDSGIAEVMTYWSMATSNEATRPSAGFWAKFSTALTRLAERDGRAIMAADSPTVYLTTPGARHAFTSADVFLGCGFDWLFIRKVSRAELDKLADGAKVSSVSMCRVLLLGLPGEPAMEDGSPVVYLVSARGTRHAFPDPNAFLKCGFQWNEVKRLSKSNIETLPASRPIKDAADCRTLRGMAVAEARNLIGKPVMAMAGNPTVYLVNSQGGKHAFKNENVYLGCGLQWSQIVKLDQRQLDALPLAQEVTDANACRTYRNDLARAGHR